MSRIFLTGSSGFIGSALSSKLIALGHELYGFERYLTGRPSEIHDFPTLFGDIRQYYQVERALVESQPEIIIHLASISPVSYSYENPFDVQETNYLGTVNLAEASIRHLPMLKQFIFASTSETYGNVPAPMHEESMQFPNSPYAVSKVGAEKYLEYMSSIPSGLPITILRPFNTYGRKKDRHFFIESLITQMLKGNEVKLGEPDIVRDFLYADDHVDAYVSAVEKQKSIGRTINICTGNHFQLEEIVQLATKITGFKGSIHWHTLPKRVLDIKELWGTNQKAKEILDWSPKVSLEEGLQRVMEYWKNK